MFAYTELKVDIEEEVAKYRVYAERVRPLVANTVAYIHKCLQENKKVLVEGANAAMLDIDFGEFYISLCIPQCLGFYESSASLVYALVPT